MKKTFLSLFFLFATLTGIMAAKSSGQVHQVQQPDGTSLSIQLLGDEHFSWYQTIDGVILVEAGNTYYVAKTDSYGAISNTGIIAHDATHRNAEEIAAISKQNKDVFFSNGAETAKSKRAQTDFSTRSIDGYPNTNVHCPHTGKIRIPVILMEYTDMKLSFDRSVYEDYFNGTGKTPLSPDTRFDGYSSVAQFFKDASFGQFEPVFELYGPYTTNNNHDYYGGKTSTLETEAVQKADKDINFSQYDSDGNGKVDMVYVLYAGTGANISGNDKDVWPSCYPGNQNISTSDGVRITTIGAANELAIYAAGSPTGKNLRAGIGVTCHEISHGLGLPDLYNTGTPYNPATNKPDYSNGGPEDWDIMDGGENLFNAMWPCIYSAWERDIMGWLKIEELTEPTNVTLYPLDDEQGRGKAYRITNPANPKEYYIIENNIRNNWNQYQYNQYGSGLMVFHINSNATGFSMSPNNTYGKPNITIIPADGYIMGLYNRGETIMYNGKLTTMPTDDSQFRAQYFRPESQGDPYPGSKGITSVAAFKNYTGDEMASNFPITDIKKNTDGSVSFKFMGGIPTPCSAPVINYENGKLTFSSDTEDVTYHYTVTPIAEAEQTTSESTIVIHAPKQYTISVYASKDNYINSETVTKTIDAGIIADVNRDGKITVADANEIVNIYLGKEQ